MTDLAARSDPGLVRERNEDRWLTRDYRGVTLLAVADGVGGEAGGDVASTAAIETLARSFRPPSFRDSARSALGDAVQQANRAVLDAAAAERFARAATTLLAAAVRGREAAVAKERRRAPSAERASSEWISLQRISSPSLTVHKI